MSEHVAKKKKISSQRYRKEYSDEWPCLTFTDVSPNFVHCKTCNCNFSIAHGGRNDCRRHVLSPKHEQNKKLCSQVKPLESYLTKYSNTNIIKAEMLFTSFIVEHNIPIAVADHAAPLFQAMFPDSEVAKQYSCARTKTTAIVKCMAESTSLEIVKVLQDSHFSLATDGSTDHNDIKLYPLVVTYFDINKGEIVNRLLSIVESDDGTGQGIFNALNQEMTQKSIPWSNCVSFGCDNANTMTGSVKGVAAFVKGCQPSIIIQGCACHLLHLAAQRATKQLKEISIESFLVDVFYYMQKSSKRKKDFKLCQKMMDVDIHKILKHVSTRWLSLLESITRILEQWDALEMFFSVGKCTDSMEKDCVKNERYMNVKKMMETPVCKLYCLFLLSVLPVFTTVNVSLQSSAPAVHLLQRKLNNVLHDLLSRFVKPSAVVSPVRDTPYKEKTNQKQDCDLVVGAKTRAYIKNNSNLLAADLKMFYKSVKQFYVEACNYILQKFPLEEEFLKHVEVCDVSCRKTASFSSVEYLVTRFSSQLLEEAQEKLEIEFAKYQADDFDINITNAARMDVAWHLISQLVDTDGVVKYSILPKIMLSALVIPHSNAEVERIFSIVRKNQTDFRPNLSTKTLSALLVEKTKMSTYGVKCFERKFDKQELEKAKHSTAAAN